MKPDSDDTPTRLDRSFYLLLAAVLVALWAGFAWGVGVGERRAREEARQEVVRWRSENEKPPKVKRPKAREGVRRA